MIAAIILGSAAVFWTAGMIILGRIVAEGERALNAVHDIDTDR